MHIIRKSVFDIKNVESGNWGGQKMWKVEIGGGGSKNVESGNWWVKNCGKWKLGGGGGAETPPPMMYFIISFMVDVSVLHHCVAASLDG